MNEQNQSQLSSSQQRRLDRKNAAIQAKKVAKRNKIIGITAVTIVSLAILFLIGNAIYKNAIRIKPTDNYSGQLNDDGMITGVTAADIVTLPEYKGIPVTSATIEVTDDEVADDIKTTVLQYAKLDNTKGLVIEDGDKVNIDYVGKIDGVEFDGGNSGGNGSDLTIGSNTFIDDFEQQLIGKAVGEEVLVEVTFPEDYSNADLAGKDATFDVTINGLYSDELTDAIVKENLSEYASTADEYRDYVKNEKRDEKLSDFLTNYFKENTTINSYPKKYMEQLKSLNKYQAQSQFSYMQQYYAAIGYGTPTFKDVFGKTEEEYDKTLDATAKETALYALVYQAIAEKEGITVTEDELNSEDNKEQIEQYGKGSVAQGILFNKVLDLVKENIVIM